MTNVVKISPLWDLWMKYSFFKEINSHPRLTPTYLEPPTRPTRSTKRHNRCSKHILGKKRTPNLNIYAAAAYVVSGGVWLWMMNSLMTQPAHSVHRVTTYLQQYSLVNTHTFSHGRYCDVTNKKAYERPANVYNCVRRHRLLIPPLPTPTASA